MTLGCCVERRRANYFHVDKDINIGLFSCFSATNFVVNKGVCMIQCWLHTWRRPMPATVSETDFISSSWSKYCRLTVSVHHYHSLHCHNLALISSFTLGLKFTSSIATLTFSFARPKHYLSLLTNLFSPRLPVAIKRQSWTLGPLLWSFFFLFPVLFRSFLPALCPLLFSEFSNGNSAKNK